jgi:hypothetical protein
MMLSTTRAMLIPGLMGICVHGGHRDQQGDAGGHTSEFEPYIFHTKQLLRSLDFL